MEKIVWKMGSQLSAKIQKRVSLFKNQDGLLCVPAIAFSVNSWSALEEFLVWVKIYRTPLKFWQRY